MTPADRARLVRLHRIELKQARARSEEELYGARLSRRLSGDRLQRALLVVVTLTALRVWWDLLRR